MYLQQSQSIAGAGHSATGLYRSDLLDDEVSIEQLRIIALSDRFRSVAGGSVEVEDVADSAYFIRVTTTVTDPLELDHAHKTAVALLSTNMRELALSDVNSDIHYLEESRKVSEFVPEEKTESTVSQDYYVKHLSREEIKRFSQLEDENKKLRAFLNNGKLDKSIEPMLSTGRVRAARQRLQKQEAELKRIARSFHADTKAFQAQKSLTETTRDDYLALLRSEATHLIKANSHEYETLDDKAAGYIEESARANVGKKNSAQERPLTQAARENQAFLTERLETLKERAEVIKAAAELKLKGELVYSQRSTMAYPLTIACWVTSLLCFLSALFVVGRVKSVGVSRPGKSAMGGRKPSTPVESGGGSPTIRIDLSGLSHRLTGEPSGDQLEGFFSTIVSEVKESLGRQPRRILVLGDSPIESRLSFSIRLANVLGRSCKKIRLIDFDFQSQSLSERLGRQNLPGVGDLLLNGGPVDEFFSSISGTKIQFAPAGSERIIDGEVSSVTVDRILGQDKEEITVIDASSASPLHIIVNQVDAVLCTSQAAPGRPRSVREQQVLVAFRDAGLPVWGVSVESTQFFPLL